MIRCLAASAVALRSFALTSAESMAAGVAEVQVTVETRVLDVDDNFTYDVGVDFRFEGTPDVTAEVTLQEAFENNPPPAGVQAVGNAIAETASAGNRVEYQQRVNHVVSQFGPDGRIISNIVTETMIPLVVVDPHAANGSIASLGIEFKVDGMLASPSNPDPGIVQTSGTAELITKPNSTDEAVTPIASYGAFVSDLDQNLLTFGDPALVSDSNADNIDDTFEIEKNLSVPTRVGIEFIMKALIFSSIDVDLRSVNAPEDWSSFSGNTFEVIITSPEGTFLRSPAAIPEPLSATLLLGFPLLGLRRSRRNGRLRSECQR